MGLVGNMDIIRQHDAPIPSGKGQLRVFADRKKPAQNLAENVVQELEVATPEPAARPIRRLSGGNVQKVLVGREIASAPTVLLTAYAVRGLDINSSYTDLQPD